MKLCECGCGRVVKEGSRFIHGHSGVLNKGKKHSEEHRKKNSDFHKGRPSPMKGKQHTEEAKEKNRIANTGKERSEKFKKNLSDFWKGHRGHWKGKKRGTYSKEHCDNISKGLKNSTKLKEAMLRRTEMQGCFPHKGKREKHFFDDLKKIAPFEIKEDYILCGFIIDGFVEEKNIAIEFDEDYHFNKDQCERDYNRMMRIAIDKKVRFIRIEEEDWLENKQEVYKFIIENVMKDTNENILVTQKIHIYEAT